MKNTDDFCYKGNPSHATAKSTPFAVSKDEWDTKEDTGKSMKNALYILRYAKGMCLAEATSNSEKIKPVALVIIELRLLKTSVSLSVTRKSSLIKFHSNLLKAFQINLKACLALVLPNQCCFIVVMEK